MIKRILDLKLFGVCEFLGHRIGFSQSTIKVNFIYLSFLTLGSPLIIYLFILFWMNYRKTIRKHYEVIS